jgi:hypothetical protein
VRLEKIFGKEISAVLTLGTPGVFILENKILLVRSD